MKNLEKTVRKARVVAAMLAMAFCLAFGTAAPAHAAAVKKGATFTKGDFKYKVTSADKSKKTGNITLTAPKDKSAGFAQVPATVKYGGYKLTVTAIGDSAFKGCGKLAKAEISKPVKTIGKDAFNGCAKLKSIQVRGTKLTKVGAGALKGTYKSLVVKVQNEKIRKLFSKKGQASGAKVTVAGSAGTVTAGSSVNSSNKGSGTSQKAREEQYPDGEYDVAKLAPKAHAKVLKAFKDLNMRLYIDSASPATGVFDAAGQKITLKYMGDHIYHELGHFLFFIAGNLDRKESSRTIYEKEKGGMNVWNASYVKQTPAEYFAESYRMYVTDGAKLKGECPKTYALVEEALAKVTDEWVQFIKRIYGF